MKEISLIDFSGGRKCTKAPHLLPDNMYPDSRNIRIDEGVPEVRLGSQKVNSTSINSPITWNYTGKIDGTNFTLIGTEDGRLMRLNVNTFIEVENSLGSQIDGVIAFDKLYYVDGLPNIGQWDGVNPPINVPNTYVPTSADETYYGSSQAAANIIEQITAPTQIIFFKNYLIVAQGSKIYISHELNPEYFPDYNEFSVNDGDGDVIAKMFVFRDEVIIEKSKSTYVLRGSEPVSLTDPFMIRTIHDKIGCEASKSAYVVDNDAIFVSKKGIKRLVNAVTKDDRNIIDITEPVQDIFNETTDKTMITAIEYKGWYWLAVPNNMVLLFDYVNNRWLVDEYPITFHCFRVDADGRLLAGADDGFLYQLDIGETDSGTNVDAWLKTKTLKPNGDKFCLWYHFVVEATAQGNYEEILEGYVDTKDKSWISASLQGSGPITLDKCSLPLQGKNCYFIIRNKDGGKLSLVSLTAYYNNRRF